MEPDEILHLKNTVNRKVLNFKDNIWKKAFAYYNLSNNSRLGMQCSICYFKVLQYINQNSESTS